MTKILAMAQEDPRQFHLGEREVTVEERRSHRGLRGTWRLPLSVFAPPQTPCFEAARRADT